MLKAYKREPGSPIQVTDDIESGEWIRLETPAPEEIHLVAEKLGLDESLLTDALDPYEAPRFEIEDKIPYVYLRYPYSDNPPGTAPLLIVITKDEIVTVARGTPSFLDRFASGDIQFHTNQRTKLLILMMAEIAARYTSSMTAIQRAVNRRKQSVSDMGENDIVELSSHEAAINTFLDALIPQANALEKLQLGKTIAVEEEDRDLIDDVILSTSQLIELGRSLLKSMENTREAYTAISTERLNKIIRRLTVLTVLITIPNVVTGFYGMNVLLPFSDSPMAFLVILVGILSSVGGVLAFLIYKKWL